MEGFQSFFALDPTLSTLVEQGVVTATVQFTKTGIDVWVRSVLPHPRLGVMPHESMTPEEAVDRLEKVISGPLRHRALPILGKPPTKGPNKNGGYSTDIPRASKEVEGAPLSGGLSFMTITAAQAKIQREGLNKVTRDNGAVNTLPAKSLTSYDVRRPSDQLLARAIVVANALGNHVILSRIRTQESLQVKKAPDLETWWARASVHQRLRILSDEKKLKDDVTEDPTVKEKTQGLQCPFRGSKSSMVLELPSFFTRKGEKDWEDSEDDSPSDY